MTNRRHTFPKAEKLKSRKQIETLFSEGKGFTIFPIRVVYLLSPHQSTAGSQAPNPVNASIQVGVSVSARHFKKAVHRNRIKRLLRESYRLQKHILQPAAPAQGHLLSVFFIFVGKEMPSFSLVADKLRQCLMRLVKQLNEKP